MAKVRDFVVALDSEENVVKADEFLREVGHDYTLRHDQFRGVQARRHDSGVNDWRQLPGETCLEVSDGEVRFIVVVDPMKCKRPLGRVVKNRRRQLAKSHGGEYNHY